jgi:indolepyruvate ferredoxin oxidoreductase beta subunit
MFDCLIAGVGGQGAILTSRIIGAAAMAENLAIRGCETIGMAQRGGSVTSHVRIGAGVFSPLISPGSADAVLAFELFEAARAVRYLKKNSLMAVCDAAVYPAGAQGNFDESETLAYLRANAPNLRVVSGKKISEICGPRSVNMAALGAALAADVFPFGLSSVERVLSERFDPKRAELNIKALRLGAETAE